MKNSIFLLLAVVGCSPAKPVQTSTSDIPPPLPIIQPQPDDVLACAHLAIIGCPEAWPKSGTCVQAMSNLRTLAQVAPDAGTFDPLKCIIGAANPAAVRTCGGPSKLTIDCAADAGAP